MTFGQAEATKFKNDQLKNKELIPKNVNNEFVTTDFSKLWTQTENESVYGFIGDNYQRIQVKFISVTKSKTLPDTYDVYGKSMVKNNVDEFRGTLKITNIRQAKITSFGIDDEYKNKGLKGQFVILGEYDLSEEKSLKHTGEFKGVFRTNFYLDKYAKVHYDDIDLGDSYNNNQFVGTWVQYDSKLIKRCNWGDYRIPNSGDFDIGAGDFSPSKGAGWKNVVDKRKWWK